MNNPTVSAALGAEITLAASKQTYFTIRYLIPPDRRDDALRAYAYFRWVDDVLDGDSLDRNERLEFLSAQRQLLHSGLDGKIPASLRLEECLLADLLQGPMGSDAGVRMYLQNMMDVMDFDTHRRGRRLTHNQLRWYSQRLATAVTEAVYAFIGVKDDLPLLPQRYQAADAAHMIHMLRDLLDDLDAGYNNVPVEVIPGDQIEPADLKQQRFRSWVQSRIDTARDYFNAGREYLMTVHDYRCRIAGVLYETRFKDVMKAIASEGYLLRRDYSDCRGPRILPEMAWNGLSAGLARPRSREEISQAKPGIYPV